MVAINSVVVIISMVVPITSIKKLYGGSNHFNKKCMVVINSMVVKILLGKELALFWSQDVSTETRFFTKW